jgi:hypothetical protein
MLACIICKDRAHLEGCSEQLIYPRQVIPHQWVAQTVNQKDPCPHSCCLEYRHCDMVCMAEVPMHPRNDVIDGPYSPGHGLNRLSSEVNKLVTVHEDI